MVKIIVTPEQAKEARERHARTLQEMETEWYCPFCGEKVKGTLWNPVLESSSDVPLRAFLEEKKLASHKERRKFYCENPDCEAVWVGEYTFFAFKRFLCPLQIYNLYHTLHNYYPSDINLLRADS